MRSSQRYSGFPDRDLTLIGNLVTGLLAGRNGNQIAIELGKDLLGFSLALQQRGLKRGMAGLCHGGGGAVAMSFELP